MTSSHLDACRWTWPGIQQLTWGTGQTGHGWEAGPGGSSAVQEGGRQGSPWTGQTLTKVHRLGQALHWRPALERLSPVLQPCSLGEEGLRVPVQGGLGDPCAHVPGRPGGRLWRGSAHYLGPSIPWMPHTSN